MTPTGHSEIRRISVSSCTSQALTRVRSGGTLSDMGSVNASTKSSEPLDLVELERDIPTTPEDIRALRQHRPRMPESWWDVLTAASEQLPGIQDALRRRKTLEGCPPFEL